MMAMLLNCYKTVATSLTRLMTLILFTATITISSLVSAIYLDRTIYRDDSINLDIETQVHYLGSFTFGNLEGTSSDAESQTSGQIAVEAEGYLKMLRPGLINAVLTSGPWATQGPDLQILVFSDEDTHWLQFLRHVEHGSTSGGSGSSESATATAAAAKQIGNFPGKSSWDLLKGNGHARIRWSRCPQVKADASRVITMRLGRSTDSGWGKFFGTEGDAKGNGRKLFSNIVVAGSGSEGLPKSDAKDPQWSDSSTKTGNTNTDSSTSSTNSKGSDSQTNSNSSNSEQSNYQQQPAQQSQTPLFSLFPFDMTKAPDADQTFFKAQTSVPVNTKARTWYFLAVFCGVEIASLDKKVHIRLHLTNPQYGSQQELPITLVGLPQVYGFNLILQIAVLMAVLCRIKSSKNGRGVSCFGLLRMFAVAMINNLVGRGRGPVSSAQQVPSGPSVRPGTGNNEAGNQNGTGQQQRGQNPSIPGVPRSTANNVNVDNSTAVDFLAFPLTAILFSIISSVFNLLYLQKICSTGYPEPRLEFIAFLCNQLAMSLIWASLWFLATGAIQNSLHFSSAQFQMLRGRIYCFLLLLFFVNMCIETSYFNSFMDITVGGDSSDSSDSVPVEHSSSSTKGDSSPNSNERIPFAADAKIGNFLYQTMFGMFLWFLHFLLFLWLIKTTYLVHGDQSWNVQQSKWFFRYLTLVTVWFSLQYLIPLGLSFMGSKYAMSRVIVGTDLLGDVIGFMIVFHLFESYDRKFLGSQFYRSPVNRTGSSTTSNQQSNGQNQNATSVQQQVPMSSIPVSIPSGSNIMNGPQSAEGPYGTPVTLGPSSITNGINIYQPPSVPDALPTPRKPGPKERTKKDVQGGGKTKYVEIGRGDGVDEDIGPIGGSVNTVGNTSNVVNSSSPSSNTATTQNQNHSSQVQQQFKLDPVTYQQYAVSYNPPTNSTVSRAVLGSSSGGGDNAESGRER